MTFNIFQWLMFFYIYCFIGWCFESAYVSIKKRRFVNRGFLRLPLLPIYGSGAIAILIVTVPIRGQYGLVFVFGMLSATCLELVTGIIMEALFKVRYWDYSNQKLNFQGYICLSSSLAWGILSVILTEVIHEPIERWVLNMPISFQLAMDAILSVLFVSDFVISFTAAWNLGKLLEKLTKIRAQGEKLKQQLEKKGEALGERLDTAKETAAEKLVSVRTNAEVRLTEVREDMEGRLELVRAELERLREEYRKTEIRGNRFFTRRLLRDNPGAVSMKFGEALDGVKKRTLQKIKDHRKQEE